MLRHLTCAISASCLAFLTVGWAQEARPLPSPEDVITPQQLVAWSSMQKPQPTPQPLPPPDKAIPQPDQPQEQQPKTAPADPGSDSTPTRSFVGTLESSGDHYVLHVAGDNDYRLDGAGDASQYQSRNVRVMGTLDKSGRTIHVVNIELLS